MLFLYIQLLFSVALNCFIIRIEEYVTTDQFEFSFSWFLSKLIFMRENQNLVEFYNNYYENKKINTHTETYFECTHNIVLENLRKLNIKYRNNFYKSFEVIPRQFSSYIIEQCKIKETELESFLMFPSIKEKYKKIKYFITYLISDYVKIMQSKFLLTDSDISDFIDNFKCFTGGFYQNIFVNKEFTYFSQNELCRDIENFLNINSNFQYTLLKCIYINILDFNIVLINFVLNKTYIFMEKETIEKEKYKGLFYTTFIKNLKYYENIYKKFF